jgi:hypothetical protein
MVPYETGTGKYMRSKKDIRPVAFACMPDGYDKKEQDQPASSSSGGRDLALIEEVQEDSHAQDDLDMGWWPIVQWVLADPGEVEIPDWVAELFTYCGCAWCTCIMQAIAQEIVAWLLYEAMFEE